MEAVLLAKGDLEAEHDSPPSSSFRPSNCCSPRCDAGWPALGRGGGGSGMQWACHPSSKGQAATSSLSFHNTSSTHYALLRSDDWQWSCNTYAEYIPCLTDLTPQKTGNLICDAKPRFYRRCTARGKSSPTYSSTAFSSPPLSPSKDLSLGLCTSGPVGEVSIGGRGATASNEQQEQLTLLISDNGRQNISCRFDSAFPIVANQLRAQPRDVAPKIRT